MARSMFAFLSVASLLSLASCRPYALPQPHAARSVLTVEQLQTVQPTLDGLASNSNVTLVVAALGIGHQNYTCNGTEFVQTVAGSGALADLFDITDYLRKHPNKIDSISEDCASGECQKECSPLTSKPIGVHYFDFEAASDKNIPTFNLSSADPPMAIQGSKIGDVPAPESTDVDWLFLQAVAGDSINNGLTEVYRVDTLGGVPSRTTCSKEGKTTSVPYLAQYWFYN